MTLSRRKAIALVGGGTLFAAAGGVAHSITRPLATALQPWDLAGTYGEARLRALSWAVLAPNPHNRQPWLVDLREPDVATVYVDTGRLLPQTDPYGRQITIGQGCFVELARMAAAQEGIGVRIALFPDGEDTSGLDARPVARLTFGSGAARADPLFAHVPARRSLKEPFDLTRPVAPEALAGVVAAAGVHAAGGTIEPGEVAAWRALTRAALRTEIETPHTFKESVDLFRIGRREVDANPDGIDFTGPLFEGLARVRLFTREAALDTSSSAYRQGLAAVFANTDTAMGHVWLVSAGNTRRDQITAGADWLRMNLAATAAGLGFQPLSQALQEYPEMAGPHAEVHERLAPGGGTVQLLARIGYGPEVPPSPRWPIDAKVLDA